MDIANARLDVLPVRDVEKEKVAWGIRTFGIGHCISNHVQNHRIHAMGIVALRKKLKTSDDKFPGKRIVDATRRYNENQLKSFRRDMRENKLIIRFLLSLEHIWPKPKADDNLKSGFRVIIGGRAE